MRRTGFFVLAAACLLAGTQALAAEVAGVRIEDQARAGSTDLVLNGAGLRTRLFFKVYAGALYLPKKSTDATAIIESTEPRRVVLHMLRNLDADSLFGALLDGLKKNHDDAEMTVLKPDIDQFERIMRGIGKARAADVIVIDFTSAAVTVAFNGQPRGSVAGASFGRALLKVWLGEKPADADLKRAMLGS